jgi:hypothetical protein
MIDLSSAIAEAKTKSLLALIPNRARRQVRGGATPVYLDFCPVHADTRTPNFYIWDYWRGDRAPDAHCFACGFHVRDSIDWVMKDRHLSFVEAVEELAGGEYVATTPKQRIVLPREEKRIYTPRDIEQFWGSMTRADYAYLKDRLGVSADTVLANQIGTIGQNMYVFPSQSFDQPQEYIALMLYDPEGRGVTTKYGYRKWRHWRSGEGAYIFRAPHLKGKRRVLIVEGGKDAIKAVDDGFDAVSLTNGALSYRPEWNRFFTDADRIYVALDWDLSKQDESGREMGRAGQIGTARINSALRRAIPIDWSKLKELFGFEITPEMHGFDYWDARKYFSLADIYRLFDYCEQCYG